MDYASASAAVAAAVERMIEDDEAREVALDAIADQIRRRAATPRSEFVEHNDVFAPRCAAWTATGDLSPALPPVGSR